MSAVALMGFAVAGHAQHGSSGALQAQTRPVSPSVLATIALSGQSVELVVLWRGSPGWFLKGTHRSASFSGGEATFAGTLEYGGLQLALSYDPVRRTAIVQGQTVPLVGGNVILVDTGDGGSVTVSDVVKVTSHVEGNPSLALLLGSSPEIVAFLRCESGIADAATNQKFLELACADLAK
jgi:hypothetical protein